MILLRRYIEGAVLAYAECDACGRVCPHGAVAAPMSIDEARRTARSKARRHGRWVTVAWTGGGTGDICPECWRASDAGA